MRPEVLEFLSEKAPAGIFRFEIGVQSTNEETNSLVKRKQNFSKLTRTVTMVKNSRKIDQHLDLIAGLPEENYDSFRKTFNDVFALDPEELQLGFLKMLRGTGLRNDAEKYGYTYMDRAPYEILGNDILPFSDIVRIKRVEDVLEKYWNAHRLDHTMNYLLHGLFPSPFDFFQAFGDYWEERGWQKIGHQLEDLFMRLREFLTQRGTERLDTVEGLMKLDYFLGHKYKPRKIWWTPSLDKQRQSSVMRLLAERPELVLGRQETHAAVDRYEPEEGSLRRMDMAERLQLRSGSFADLRIGEKELYKHVMLEVVPFDLARYMADGSLERGSSILVAYYGHEGGKPHIYGLPAAAVTAE